MTAPRKRSPAAIVGTVSIARALSKLGICSRTEVERMVLAGRVTVDGRVVHDVTRRVRPETAVIEIDGVQAARVDLEVAGRLEDRSARRHSWSLCRCRARIRPRHRRDDGGPDGERQCQHRLREHL